MQKVVLGKDTTRPESKQIQFLENKVSYYYGELRSWQRSAKAVQVNKLRWVNDDLSKQIFTAIQRGHRLAAKLGYQDLSEAEAALATQAGGGGASETQQSQLEQLSQYPSEELASHVQELQSELASHVQLSKSTLRALGDALNAITALREENEKLREEPAEGRDDTAGKTAAEAGREVKMEEGHPDEAPLSSPDRNELAYLSAEHADLKDKYTALHKAKQAAEDKHSEDYRRWREFKRWLDGEIQKADRDESVSKRRKLGADDEDEKKDAFAAKGGHKTKGKGYERLRKVMVSNPRLRSQIRSKIPTLGKF